MYLIGLHGKIGSGKTTLTNYLCDKYDYIEVSFAKPLKDIAMILGFNYEDVYGTQAQKIAVNKDMGVSGREFLQLFGTDICRNYLPSVMPDLKSGNSIWIEIAKKTIKKKLLLNKKVIVSDARFMDEIDVLKSMGATIINIKRPDLKYDTHESEKDINITYDYIINNDGTINDLYNNLDDIIVQLDYIL